MFVPKARVVQAYRLTVFVQEPGGLINLAKTAVAIGLDAEDRLVSYLAFQADQGLSAARWDSPLRLNDADQQVMLYVFLALAAFIASNQGRAPLRGLGDKTARIG